MNDLQNNLNDRDALLSAYIDGELDVADRRRVEALIKNDPGYAQDVEELRLLKRWLHDLPSPAARRSFTLDPATAPRPRRLLFPTLRWATAVAAVLLMLTVSVDVLGTIGSGFGGGAAGSTTSGAMPAASVGSAADQESARSFSSAAASAANEAQDLPDTAAQNAQPSASGSAAAAAGASAAAGDTSGSASVAPSASLAALALPSASAGASASAAASAFASFSPSMEQGATTAGDVYPAPSNSVAAATLPSASGASDASSAGSDAGGARSASPLASTGTTAPDTTSTTLRAEPQAAPVNTLRIAQIVLLIATTVLGAGAWFARRRNI